MPVVRNSQTSYMAMLANSPARKGGSPSRKVKEYAVVDRGKKSGKSKKK